MNIINYGIKSRFLPLFLYKSKQRINSNGYINLTNNSKHRLTQTKQIGPYYLWHINGSSVFADQLGYKWNKKQEIPHVSEQFQNLMEERMETETKSITLAHIYVHDSSLSYGI